MAIASCRTGRRGRPARRALRLQGRQSSGWRRKIARNPYFTFEASKCIVCSRCVRACEEVQGTFALTIVGRGFDSKVSPGGTRLHVDRMRLLRRLRAGLPDRDAERKERHRARQARARGRRRPAPIAASAAPSRPRCKGDKVVRMVPDKDGKANHGHSCVKGRFAWGYATHKDRITKPMIRASITDPWREVSWDEAIDHAASEFKRIQAKYGRDSIGAITSSRCTNEEAYPRCRSWCAPASATTTSTPARASAIRRPAMASARPSARRPARRISKSVEKSDVILVIGANPTDAHPVFASRMKKRLRAGREADRRRSAPHRPGASRRMSRPTTICRCCPAPTSPSSMRWRMSSSPKAGRRGLRARALRLRRFRELGALRRRRATLPEAT